MDGSKIQMDGYYHRWTSLKLLLKAPDGFEPPQKALLALPFPVGYGAIIKSTKNCTNNEAIDCPNFEMGGHTIRFDYPLRPTSQFFALDAPSEVSNVTLSSNFRLLMRNQSTDSQH
jgi:hypothetical protein